ncbi:DUF3467 domain-containing protein [Roseobacter sp. HKCCA0434]|uniref:DUF3467 domain-containing protein n=1 Tax=Roseobacter sp. HKCCA0434 TaxID=3079297 RepID=UPI002905B904|nr:DUF3467 domain-containing protein [Roseobacter sp. HKCCA0434]
MTQDSSPMRQTLPNGVELVWNDADIMSSYANVATATATQEEFFLLFGQHQSWKGVEEGGSVEIQLNTRMVMNPAAAKRFAAILVRSLEVYEERFGKIGG